MMVTAFRPLAAEPTNAPESLASAYLNALLVGDRAELARLDAQVNA